MQASYRPRPIPPSPRNNGALLAPAALFAPPPQQQPLGAGVDFYLPPPQQNQNQDQNLNQQSFLASPGVLGF